MTFVVRGSRHYNGAQPVTIKVHSVGERDSAAAKLRATGYSSVESEVAKIKENR